ncbi:hypothetical protein ABZ801_15990 [Actinomadura sp. NPDC047616]|uniref:hypothetical protein n=1 Tax=Actinomadura sp. NPDC047616 TaxID=3155914 RepID=UPI0033E09E9F
MNEASAPTIREAALHLREGADSWAERLQAFTASVGRLDGQHVDLGRGTADKRAALRSAARAADDAVAALSALSVALGALAEAWGVDDA